MFFPATCAAGRPDDDPNDGELLERCFRADVAKGGNLDPVGGEGFTGGVEAVDPDLGPADVEADEHLIGHGFTLLRLKANL